MTLSVDRHPTRAGARARGREAKRRVPFVAVDGEAVAGEYVLMRASDGSELFDGDGIATKTAFEWLLNLASQGRGIFVAFGFSYDVNMILRDIDHETLKTLWTTGEAWVMEEYYVEWIPGKLFVLTGYAPKRYQIKIYDTFGFFQSSFIRALETWNIGSSELIERMKAERQDFTLDDIEEISAYCLEECEKLAELMEDVRDALDDVGLTLKSWLGAGAIASALMSREKVGNHLPRRDVRRKPAIEEAILRAYFGGRTELFQQGELGHVIARDINSAYPSEAIGLPSMLGTWRRARTYDPAEPWAIWRVKWNCPAGTVLAPFPFRHKRSITYPLDGEGYYHACEVAAALTLYPDDIEVTSGYVYRPESEEKPFRFLPEIYAERKQLKAAGHAGEKVLKLGINSVYGKLAQGHGRNGFSAPPFQDYFWAGRITAGTRAKVFRASAQCPDNLVGIATDGIMFRGGEPDIPESSELGEWERGEYDDFFVAQPGMYVGTKPNGERVVHSRGFFTKEIDWDALRAAWREDWVYGEVACPSHRFIGLGSALLRRNMDVWRTWHDGTRTIKLYSSRKFYADDDERLPSHRLIPPMRPSADISAIYVPKGGPIELDDESADYIAGIEQPLISSG